MKFKVKREEFEAKAKGLQAKYACGAIISDEIELEGEPVEKVKYYHSSTCRSGMKICALQGGTAQLNTCYEYKEKPQKIEEIDVENYEYGHGIILNKINEIARELNKRV